MTLSLSRRVESTLEPNSALWVNTRILPRTLRSRQVGLSPRRSLARLPAFPNKFPWFAFNLIDSYLKYGPCRPRTGWARLLVNPNTRRATHLLSRSGANWGKTPTAPAVEGKIRARRPGVSARASTSPAQPLSEIRLARTQSKGGGAQSATAPSGRRRAGSVAREAVGCRCSWPLVNWMLRFHAGERNPRKFHHLISEQSPMNA